MNLIWVVFEELERSSRGLTSRVASIRYRALLPAAELASKGYISRFEVVSSLGAPMTGHPLNLKADAIVFSKSFSPFNEVLMSRARASGTQVVFDISDNHFETRKYAAHYRAMASQASAITVPTPAMRLIVQEHTGRDATVIPDPVEGMKASPAFSAPMWMFGQGAPEQAEMADGRSEELRLLWYGHPSNLKTLATLIPQFKGIAARVRTLLRVVSREGFGAERICTSLSSAGIEASFHPWSMLEMRESLDWCDLVVLPTDAADRHANVKSANRVVEALWAGRFVVASPIDAYQEFAPFAWVDEDLAEGVFWATQNPAKVLEKVSAAQRYISEHFAPATIAAQWHSILMRPISRAEAKTD